MNTHVSIADLKAESAAYLRRAKENGETLTLCQGRDRFAKTKGFRSWAALAASTSRQGRYCTSETISLAVTEGPKLQASLGAADLKPVDVPLGEVPFWRSLLTLVCEPSTHEDVQNGSSFLVTPIDDDDPDTAFDKVVRFERDQHKVVVASFTLPNGDDRLVLFASSRKAQLALANDTSVACQIRDQLDEANAGPPHGMNSADLNGGFTGFGAPFVGARFVAVRNPYENQNDCPWPVGVRRSPFEIDDIDPFDRKITFHLADEPSASFRLDYKSFIDSFAMADEFGD